MSTKEALARLLWAEIAGAGQRQCDIAATVGISEKHLSQMINGKSGMSLALVDQILAVCGRRLVLATEPFLPAARCPQCFVERADYEGEGKHLPTCPNCGTNAEPEVIRV